ncbi:MAG: hypothetical protein LBO82_05965 [Synergistaceae bacterium]|jgi:hypothetical protein|nr:hypothetical protein [Synergistaceae bacterium]
MPAMTDCVWYVSGFRRPWEAAVIGGLAAALKAKGGALSLQVYVDGGTANFRAEGAMSWRSLTFFEKLAAVLFKGKLWHLWGEAPFWWGLVRLRARTVHTSLDDAPEWRGHPTRLFEAQARHGESLIAPAFEARVVRAGKEKGEEVSEEPPSAVILAASPGAAFREVLDELKTAVVPLAGAVTDSTLRQGGVLFAGDGPSDALLAAYLTTQGIPVLAASETPLLDAVLGRSGYIVPRTGDTRIGDTRIGDREGWRAALGEAFSEAGRASAASARRFLKDRYDSAEAAKSLENLYRAVMGKNV